MAAKEYSIAFAIAGSLAGNFAKTFQTANDAVQGFNQKINDLNKQAGSTGNVLKLRQEVSEAARATIDAKKKFNGLSRQYEASSARVTELSNAHAAAKRRVYALERSAAKSGTTTQAMAQKYDAAVAEVAKLGKELEYAKRETDGLGKMLGQAQTAVDKSKQSLDKKRESLKKTEIASGTLGQKTADLVKRQEELTKSADRARAAQEKLAKINERVHKASAVQDRLKGNAWSSVSTLSYMAAAATGPISIPVKAAIDMEDAMAEINKVIDFDTPDGLKNLQKQLEEMSLRIPMSADGLAKIAAAAGQSGIAANDLAGFTEQAAKMAVAFDITAEEAGEMMSKWQSGMGLSLERTYKLADATNMLSNQNAALASQIGAVLKRYGAMGSVAGLTETQTAAFAASVIASGAGAEEAATGIKAFMRAMGKGGSMSELQEAAFKNAGLDPKVLQKNLQKDAPATIIETLEAIQKKIPKEKWNQYLSVMFGEEAAVAVGPMMKNLDGIKKNFAMVADEANYGGSMLKEFESRSATTSNSLVLAQNAAYYAARALGDAMLEPLKGGASMFVSFAQSVGNLIKENQDLVSFFVKVATASGIAYASFHALRIVMFAVVSPIISVYKAYLSFQKALELANLAMASGEKLTIAQRAVILADAAATKVATVAKKAWAMALDGSLLALIREKSALWANKIAVHAQTAAVKIATLAQKAWAVALVVGPLIAQKAALLAHKAATLAHVMAIKGAAIAQKTWIAALTIGPLVAQKAALIALQGAMLAWKGVCMVVTVAQKALNFVLMANPIGLVITAVGGLVAAGVALYQNWDAIKQKVKELWEWISNFFGKIAETISNVWEKVKSFFGFGGKETTVNVATSSENQKAHQQQAQTMSKVAAPKPATTLNANSGAESAQPKTAAQSYSEAIQNARNVEDILAANRAYFKQINSVSRADPYAIAREKSVSAANKIGGVENANQIASRFGLPGLASGGIVTKPTVAMVGEGRESEAVLPLSKLGGMLGRGGSQSNSVNVNLTVNVQGSSQDAYSEVKRGISEGTANLKRELERLLNDQRRLSYV